MAPLDPDPYISIGNTDPDSGQSKLRSKREKIQRFQVEKSIDLLNESLMVFTKTWDSFIKVFWALCEGKSEKNVRKLFSFILV